MSNPETTRFFEPERAARTTLDLEIAQMKQNNPLVSDQELQWRLNLLPDQTPDSMNRLRESVEFALGEELRQAGLRATREVQKIENNLIFITIAYLMIYGRNKSD